MYTRFMQLSLIGLIVVILLLFIHPARSQSPLFVSAPGSPIHVDGGVNDVDLADVSGDGRLDLVVTSEQDRAIKVLIGQGDGQFLAPQIVPVAPTDGLGDLIVKDFTGDGKLDLAIASHDSYNVRVLLGDGSGGFKPAPGSPVRMKTGQHPHTHGIDAGDLNGDGHLDVVTGHYDDSEVAIVFGDGRGNFAPAPESPIATVKRPYPLAVGDINHDGFADIAVPGAAPSSSSVAVLLSDGHGRFQRSEVSLRTVQPWFVAIGDMNGDGNPDLVTTHWERRELTVLTGDGKGGFAEIPASPFDLGGSAWHIALTDMNADGSADVIAAGDGITVMLNDGSGGLVAAPGSPFASGIGTWRLTIEDVNGDGKLDVAAPDYERSSVIVLLAP